MSFLGEKYVVIRFIMYAIKFKVVAIKCKICCLCATYYCVLPHIMIHHCVVHNHVTQYLL